MPKFISEVDVEARKKIQEDEGIVEAPYDARSLYERLQAEKDRKQEEYEATNALKNRIHRLDEDEVDYLQTLSAKQYKADLEKEEEIAELVKEAKTQANRPVHVSSTNTTTSGLSAKSFYNKGGSSQRALMASAVKRNSSLDIIGPLSKRANTRTSTSNDPLAKLCTDESNYRGISKHLNRPLDILPGLSDYSDSDSEKSTDSTSDDSTDIEDSVCTLQQIACTRMLYTKTEGSTGNGSV
ncbi:unnamed protein product [Trichobilharzia szidati]|nr:unnamed protein product [Trichobilharzia szidati]CAH8821458.1 unnamed protein product [Trichobilharzia szidati]CAH8871639.1 unnamed protein product [Trichobilharzia szidati]CAH8871641.1 unnamed protein product [Trichobilharzia szidati]CAH8871643.1 unnamed protein product [Trichobilharzia szidati]